MKKVYYLGHCGSGTTQHYELLDLVRDNGHKLTFHINDFDFDKGERRTITLTGYRSKKTNYKGETFETIDFHSSKKQYKFYFIRVIEIEDNIKPEKTMILH